MIRIFKTNVSDWTQVNNILRILATIFPHSYINFDLEDIDKILRVDAREIPSEEIVNRLHSLGYECVEID